MLAALRSATQSWIVRGFLLVIASTFALYFGSGASMFASLANQPVAQVGKIEISQTEFAEAYRQRFLDLSGQLTPDQARQFGLPFSVLSELVGGALIDNAARSLGIAASDALLAADIRAQVGAISQSMYQSMLRQQGLTVPEFERLVRRDLVRAQLSAAVAPQPSVPRLLADTLYKYRQQRRIVEYVIIPAADATDIGTADDAALVEYYTTNGRRYTAPEFREVVWVALRPEDVAATVQVGEAAVAEEYAARRQEFTTPDTRGLSQLFFNTEAEAIAARQRIDQGVPFAEAGRPPAATPAPAAPAGGAPAAAIPAADTTSLGTVRREELAADIAEPVFALEEGAVSQPLRSVFGWHVYKVNSVQRGGTKALAEVQEQLRAELAREQALAELYSLSVTLDDALAAGATLEVAAQRVGLTAFKETIDIQGRNRGAQAILNLPPFAQFLPLAFRTEKGRESRLIDAPEGGYFVLRIDDILAPAPLPLDTIKERVQADWFNEQRGKRTEAAAQVFLDKAKTNGDIVAYATEAGLKAETTPPFTRSGLGLDAANTLSPALVGQMFTASVGDFGLAPIFGGYSVARLKEIVAVEPAEALEAVATIRGELGRNMSNDILSAYQTALREEYGIEINERALDQALTVATQGLATIPAR